MAESLNYSRHLQLKISFQTSSGTLSMQQDTFCDEEDHPTMKTCDQNALCGGEVAEIVWGQISGGNKNGLIMDFLL